MIHSGEVLTIADATERQHLHSGLPAAPFELVEAICTDPLNLNGWWVGDMHAIWYCDGETIKPVAGCDYTPGFADGVGEAARFCQVNGLVCTTRDRKRLYVSDKYNNRIRCIEIDRREVSTIAGSGAECDDDGLCLEAGVTAPGQIAFDRSPLVEPESVLWIVGRGLRRCDMKAGNITSAWCNFNSPGSTRAFHTCI